MQLGSSESWAVLKPILSKIAAGTEVNLTLNLILAPVPFAGPGWQDGPCVAHMGGAGAGNYVKMVHNGIEYGDMQLIAEIYDVLHTEGMRNLTCVVTLMTVWQGSTTQKSQTFSINGTVETFNHSLSRSPLSSSERRPGPDSNPILSRGLEAHGNRALACRTIKPKKVSCWTKF